MCASYNYFQNLTLKIQDQCYVHGQCYVYGHKVGPTSCRLTSLLFHVNWLSHYWDTAFSKFDLDIQGQGHEWGETLMSHNQPSIHYFLFYVSAQPFLSQYGLGGQKIFPCSYANHVNFEENSFKGFHRKLKSPSIPEGGGTRPKTIALLLPRVTL